MDCPLVVGGIPGLMLSLSNPEVGSDIRGRDREIEWKVERVCNPR
jgi:hypothetical protein